MPAAAAAAQRVAPSRLPRGETGILADSARVALERAGSRRILAAYLLSPEQRSLIDCLVGDASGASASASSSASSVEAAGTCAFGWDASHVRALRLSAAWRPLREAPLHPLEATSAVLLPARTDVPADALRALTDASRRSGHTTALLHVGPALSSAKEAVAAAAERAAQFDATAGGSFSAGGSAGGSDARSPARAAALVASVHAEPTVVDFLDRSMATLTRESGFSHLAALGPRESCAPAGRMRMLDSLEISLARMRGEAFLACAGEAVAAVCGEVSGCGSYCADSAEHAATHAGVGYADVGCEAGRYGAGLARPAVLHVPAVSAAVVARLDLASAASARRRARLEAEEGVPPGGASGEGGDGSDEDYHGGGGPGDWARAPRGDLPSRHDLPSQGNWVRLSATHQVPASLPARAARRPSAHTTFGSEQRCSSASCRWSYQTALPFTKRSAGGAAAGARAKDVPPAAGSFLPLRLANAMEWPSGGGEALQAQARLPGRKASVL